jgi:hypothetical protein
MTKKYSYYVQSDEQSRQDVGDTGTIEAESAQEAADKYAAELHEIGDCRGQVVIVRAESFTEQDIADRCNGYAVVA